MINDDHNQLSAQFLRDLLAVLNEYGSHKHWCHPGAKPTTCKCGFAQRRAALKKDALEILDTIDLPILGDDDVSSDESD